MMPAVLFVLIELHTVDGSVIQVAPQSIISMHGRRSGQLFAEGAKCLLNLADGKFIVVRETCEEVTKLVEGSEK